MEYMLHQSVFEIMKPNNKINRFKPPVQGCNVRKSSKKVENTIVVQGFLSINLAQLLMEARRRNFREPCSLMVFPPSTIVGYFANTVKLSEPDVVTCR